MLAKMDDPRRESIANSKQKAIDNKIQKRTKLEEGIQQTKEKEEEKIGEEKRKNEKGSTDSKEGQHCIWPTAAAAGQKLWGIFICLQIDYLCKKKKELFVHLTSNLNWQYKLAILRILHISKESQTS